MDNSEILNTPQAKFVMNLIRKDNPQFTEEEVKAEYLKRLGGISNPDGGEVCLACGS